MSTPHPLLSEVRALLEQWHPHCDAWSRAGASDIYELAESLADRAQTAKQDDLSEALLGFSAYLSSFADSALLPSPAQLKQLQELAKAIEESADRLQCSMPATSLGQPRPAPKGPRICLLSSRPDRWADVVAALEGREFELLSFSQADGAANALLAGDIQALVVDADRLVAWRKTIEARPNGEALPQVPCVVVSDSDQLSLRLLGIRCGADGFFAPPTTGERVAQRVAELIADRNDPYRVLIVDDDASMTLFCDSVLRHNGMRTHTINAPEAALDALSEFYPDVILVDLYMPEISGMELLALFRAHPRTVFTPVILLSGDDDVERRFDALYVGGDDYLTKPIRPRHLVAAVTSRARRSRWLRRELKEAQQAE